MELDWIKSLPKVNLDVNLEGATTIETYLELAEKNKVLLPFINAEDGYKYLQFENFRHYLKIYYSIIKAIQEPSDFKILIDRFAKSQSDQNIAYCEFTFTLSPYVVSGIDPNSILDEVNFACREAEANYNIKLRCIPTLSRKDPLLKLHNCVGAIIRARGEYIIGLGLHGSELVNVKKFTGLFQIAKHAGLHLTANVGEWRNPNSIWEAINSLNVNRICYSNACVKDSDLLLFLETTKFPISLCTSQSKAINAVSSDTNSPILDLLIPFRNGLNIAVCSHNPIMFFTSLNNELSKIMKHGLSKCDIVGILERNINCSFMPIAEKDVQNKALKQAAGIK